MSLTQTFNSSRSHSARHPSHLIRLHRSLMSLHATQPSIVAPSASASASTRPVTHSDSSLTSSSSPPITLRIGLRTSAVDEQEDSEEQYDSFQGQRHRREHRQRAWRIARQRLDSIQRLLLLHQPHLLPLLFPLRRPTSRCSPGRGPTPSTTSSRTCPTPRSR